MRIVKLQQNQTRNANQYGSKIKPNGFLDGLILKTRIWNREFIVPKNVKENINKYQCSDAQAGGASNCPNFTFLRGSLLYTKICKRIVHIAYNSYSRIYNVDIALSINYF